MPMSVHADESQDAFMERCMHEMSQNEDRTNEQNVAICMDIWRNKSVSAEATRAYSVLEVKSVDSERREIEGIASTPTVDRVGDIVEPMGAKFTLPMPLLHHHKHDAPVGHVIAAKATKDGITIKARLAKIAEPGALKDRVDLAWQELKAGLVRGLSIGFKPIEYEFLEGKSGGLRFSAWNWFELSLVTIPAQQDATITLIKSLDLQALPAALGETETGSPSSAPRSGKSTGSVKIPKREERKMSTYSEQATNIEATLVAKKDRMGAIMQKSIDEGRSTDDGEQTEFDDLQSEVERLNADLKRLRTLEKLNVADAKPISNGEVKTVEDGSNARGGHIQVKMPDLPPGIRFARVVKSIGIAKGNIVGAVQVAEAMWPDDKPIANILKAAIAAGSTTNQPWAGALVSAEGAVFAELLEFLRPQTILGKFGTGGIPDLRRIPFRVPIGTQTSGGAGYWVGEGMAKPLTAFDFTRVTLEPLKVANIVVVTEELLRYAAIPAETMLRDQIVEALRARLDTDFIDPTKTAVPGTSPASITNGVTTVTSAGASADAVRADVAAVMQAFINANNPPTSGVWVMDATTALRLSMMTGPLGEPQDFSRNLTMNGGTFAGMPVIVSEYVGEFAGSPGAANVWLVAARDVALADEGGFNVDMSREASLVMDNAPVMSSGGIGSPDSPVAAQMVSMFQTNSVAFRAERTINWTKLRAEAVQGISNVQWGT
jgi:HK97 family phage major capsid protein/HK97 family phage prohead protease